ncbi:EamA family transporter [uncultured Pantoea sp.]|uniref:DMT family transporter n=1 Tax=uncultured Pantoea sp. TaxID=218084 RepID=UPI0027D9ADAA|nr:EamA family transporter [uncultured Pantoea sp.]
MAKNSVSKNRSGLKSGWLSGLAGVVIFSGSLPATRIAVQEMDPFFLTFLRASVAGVLAIMLILFLIQTRPQRSQLISLIIVALAVVVGFPLLTAMALRHVSSAHSIVFLGLLPMATAIFGVVRGGERPRLAFWIFSVTGSLLVMGFALFQAGAISATGDLLMLASVVVCGFGYAEGAKLTRELGGWQVICWALIIALPVMLVATIETIPEGISDISLPVWLALGYVSLFSMLIGFIFWYRGLASEGIAAVGQLQLLQPFFGLGLSATLLSETVSPVMIMITLGVLLCVIGSRRFAH